jgi:hypothetical protein
MPGRSGRDEMQNTALAPPTRAFGAPLGPAASVNATDRPKPGPAAPNVQRAALAQQGLYRKPVGATATPAAPKPVAARPAAPPTATSAPAGSLAQKSYALDPLGPLGRAASQIQANPGATDQAVEDQSK